MKTEARKHIKEFREQIEDVFRRKKVRNKDKNSVRKVGEAMLRRS